MLRDGLNLNDYEARTRKTNDSDRPTVLTPSAEPSPSKASDAGEQFGSYRIVRQIGQGGMGTVYEAWHEETQRRVALKLLLNPIGSLQERERFLREGRLAASLNHRNTVYVFGTEEIAGRPVIVMEFVTAGTLRDEVQRNGPMSVPRAAGAVLQIIAGLEAMGSLGILHCDIKPSNCFIDADGSVKVGDFGLSLATRTNPDGRPGAVRAGGGTPGYAAPEQLRGEPVDVRADIYSVGMTLFYLVTGQLPFAADAAGPNPSEVFEPPKVSRAVLRRRNLPRKLVRIVACCLERNPARRFQDYAALRVALSPLACRVPVRPTAAGVAVRVLIVGFVFCCPVVIIPAVGLAELRSLESPVLYALLCFGVAVLAAGLIALLRLLEITIPGGRFAGSLNLLLHAPLVLRLRKASTNREQRPPRPVPPETAEIIGPYRIVHGFGERTTSAVLLARDTALQRDVWLRLHPPGASSPAPVVSDLRRPTRARLLGSSRDAEGGWDAYEALPGAPLLSRIGRRQSWRKVREWLLPLGQELELAWSDGSLPARLEPDQVWITPTGRPVLLDFPAPGLATGVTPDSSPTSWRPEDGQLFLKQAALIALEGRNLAADEAAFRGAEVPLPTHARNFLSLFGGHKTLSAAIAALEAVMNRPVAVSRTSRFGVVLLSGLLLGLLAGVLVVLDLGLRVSLIVTSASLALPVATVFLTRSNWILSMARLRLVTTQGAAVPRLQQAARMTLVLAPSLFALLAFVQHWRLAFWGLAIVVLIGTIWIVVSPERSLQDRMAGTCLVPDD
jgi:hypothetical protein